MTMRQENQTYQYPANPPHTRTIPSSRGVLGDYITPVLVDLWNTAPYLHDGSAHTLLDVIRPCNPALDDCLEAGRGRNLRIAGVNGQEMHGATSFLTPQQLNDLVDFQNALTLDTVVGTNERVINAGSLTLKKAVLRLPKLKKNGRTKGQLKVLATGTLSGGGDLDPARGVTLSVATPKDGRMVIVERMLTLRRSGNRFKGRDGGLSLALRRKGDGFAFTVSGKGPDVSVLSSGSQDLTVAFEFGKTGDFAQAQFVQNRNLVGKKNVFTLPKKKRHRA